MTPEDRLDGGVLGSDGKVYTFEEFKELRPDHPMFSGKVTHYGDSSFETVANTDKLIIGD